LIVLSSEVKSSIYRVVIFALAIWLIQLLLAWVWDAFVVPKPKNVMDLKLVFLCQEIQDYLELVLLFVSGSFIAKKITNLKYWKIVLGLLGIIVLNYHFVYIYDAIDYYLIQDLNPKLEKKNLESMLSLISSTPSPPNYAPVQHLICWQLLIYSPWYGVFLFLFYGSVARVFWISGILFFYFRFKRQKELRTKEIE
jgi:hypothetical protein